MRLGGMSHPPQTPRRFLGARYGESRVGWPISVFVHGMLLAIILLARHAPGGPPTPPPQEGVEMVFENGQKAPIAAPHTGRYVEIPRGELPGPRETPTAPRSPPPAPSTTPAPQINLLPPEMQAPPLPPEANAQPSPAPARTEHKEKPRRRAAPQSNPFAHMALPNFAEGPQRPSRGLRNSRSMDLSMGPVVQGGQLRDAVPHVASAGADGDYMEALGEYVETHKFYPEQAGRNGEQGTAVVRALIARDGTVKDVRLEQSSESRMLDVALISMFRSKHLPPFPEDMKEKEREFTISMTYEIVY